MRPRSHLERRRNQRIATPTGMWVSWKSGQRGATSRVEDFSMSGAFIASEETVALGSRRVSQRFAYLCRAWRTYVARGFVEMQGGLPIVVDGEVIGAIGASFDTPEHDVQIAQAGLAAFNNAMHR